MAKSKNQSNKPVVRSTSTGSETVLDLDGPGGVVEGSPATEAAASKPPPTPPTSVAGDAVPTGDAGPGVATPTPGPVESEQAPEAGTQPPSGEHGDEAMTEGPNEPATQLEGEPSIDTVLGTLAGAKPAVGYRQRTPKPRLSGEESETQRALFQALQEIGVPVRDQGGVYPYLLRQVRRSIVGE